MLKPANRPSVTPQPDREFPSPSWEERGPGASHELVSGRGGALKNKKVSLNLFQCLVVKSVGAAFLN
jgi:hypothetical protein